MLPNISPASAPACVTAPPSNQNKLLAMIVYHFLLLLPVFP